MSREVRSPHWCQTFRGRAFYFMDPEPADFDIEEIATALSRLMRFNGHSKWPYSVAQHSVLVSKLCKYPLAGLLHDAHEAYTGDMITSVKWLMEDLCPGFRANWNYVTDTIDAGVIAAFNVGMEFRDNEDVKFADLKALSTERRDLMQIPPMPWIDLPEPANEVIEEMTIGEARRAFLDRYSELQARS